MIPKLSLVLLCLFVFQAQAKSPHAEGPQINAVFSASSIASSPNSTAPVSRYSPATYHPSTKLTAPPPSQLSFSSSSSVLSSRNGPRCLNPVTLAQGNPLGFLSYTAMSGRTIIYNDQSNTSAGSITYAHDAGNDKIFGTTDDRPGIVLGQSYNEWGATISGRYAAWQTDHLSTLEYKIWDAGPNQIFGDQDDLGMSSVGSIQKEVFPISALPVISGKVLSWFEWKKSVVYFCALETIPGMTSCFDSTRVNRFDSRDLSFDWFVRDAFVHADAATPNPHIFYTGWDIPSWKAQVKSFPGLGAPLRVEQNDARVANAFFGFDFLSNSDFTELSIAQIGTPFRYTFRPQGLAQVRSPVVSKRAGIQSEFLVAWENFGPFPRMEVEVGHLLHPGGPQSLLVPNPLNDQQLYPSVDGNAVTWLAYPRSSAVTELQTTYCAF